jgi:superfamily I DNA and/or RNA helicase
MEKFCPPARHLRLEVNTQFRCRQQIADICSNLFYQGLVKTHESVLSRNTHLLSVLPAVGVIAHHHKSTKGTLSSQQNLQEAELVIHFIKKKIDFFQHEKKSVAIISFFCAQVALLSQLVRETGLDPLNLQVHTVDSCQGAEADIVILSVVSSDSARSFKFIADPNRLNVALSRAKDHLIIFANESVLKTEPYSSICRSSNVLTL